MSNIGKTYAWPENVYRVVFGVPRTEQCEMPEDAEQTIACVLETLTSREKDTIVRRYVRMETQQEIADAYGVTKSRARVIVEKALRKMRHPSRSKALMLGIREYERRKTINMQRIEASVKTTSALAEEELWILGLSVRAYNCLCRAGCRSVLDVVKMNPSQLYKSRGVGRIVAREIKDKLMEIGIDYVDLHRNEFDKLTMDAFGVEQMEEENAEN